MTAPNDNGVKPIDVGKPGDDVVVCVDIGEADHWRSIGFLAIDYHRESNQLSRLARRRTMVAFRERSRLQATLAANNLHTHYPERVALCGIDDFGIGQDIPAWWLNALERREFSVRPIS